LYGVCTNPEYPLCIVTEYVAEGSLFDAMHNGTVEIDGHMTLAIALDIARGMAHLHVSYKGRNEVLTILSGRKYSPVSLPSFLWFLTLFDSCDLAARNLLVSVQGENSFIVKVADFGLSSSTENGAVAGKKDSKIPVKWSPPEVLNERKFSKASDVWSFGIVLWEILEKKVPYGAYSNAEVIPMVTKGYRLPKPERVEFKEELWTLITSCWEEDPSKRPTFSDICTQLEALQKGQSTNDTKSSIQLLEDNGTYAFTPQMGTYNTREEGEKAENNYQSQGTTSHYQAPESSEAMYVAQPVVEQDNNYQ
jgi:serine/threonine protein kinase